MRRIILAVAAACFWTAGCAGHRDYKSADFSGEKVYKSSANVPQLSENEVLGIGGGGAASDEEIRRVLDQTGSVRIAPGSKVLLVQSGANHPDLEMVREISKHLNAIPHTGIPGEVNSGDGNAGRALRLAAARGNAETLIVYWGRLELFRDDLPTSIVSWVPVVDFVVPDEYQKARMHLTVAVVDVRTGKWSTFRTDPVEADALTTRYARERSPRYSFERAKARLYRAAVKKIAESHLSAGT